MTVRRVLTSNAFHILSVLFIYFLFADSLPFKVHQLLYTASIAIKDAIMLLIPVIAFVFIAYAFISFGKQAPLLISVLLVFIAVSGLIGTWYGLLCAKFVSNSLEFAKASGPVSYALEPMFVLPITRPAWWAADRACLLGLCIGLVVVIWDIEFATKALSRARDVLQRYIVKFLGRVMPLFVLGFVVQMHESRLITSMLSTYALSVCWLLVALVLYSAIVALIGTKGNVPLAVQDIKNMIGACVISATSGSSLVAMPLAIKAVEKNLNDTKIPAMIIPFTTNMQMVGDCILNVFLCFLIYVGFYGVDPDFSTLLSFSIMFISMRFSGSAIMGGTIFLMLPLYEEYLRFTPDMLFLISAFNVLLDPIDGFFNVLINGLLCRIFASLWNVVQRSYKTVSKKCLPIGIFIVITIIVLTTVMKLHSTNTVKPPIANRIEYKTSINGETIVDEYHWLRDSNWPNVSSKEVLAYLAAENKYAYSVLQKSQNLQHKICGELHGRISEDDMSVPYRDGDYFYYSKIAKGQQYWVAARKKVLESDVVGEPTDIFIRKDIPEQIILDENEMADANGDNSYLKVGAKAVSPRHDMLAYSVDVSGSERFTIRVKDLDKNSVFPDVVTDAMPDVVWHENNKGFFYIPAGERWRAVKVFYHAMGTDQKEDILVYHETDDEYAVSIRKSESRRYLFIDVASKESSEVLYVDLTREGFSVNVVKPRQQHVLYHVTHNGDFFYMLTNDNGANFRLLAKYFPDTASVASSSLNHEWIEIIPHSLDEYLVGLYMYRNNLVLLTKRGGLKRVKIYTIHSGTSVAAVGAQDGATVVPSKAPVVEFEKEVTFQEQTYDVGVLFTTFDAQAVRYYYSSLGTPYSVHEVSFTSLRDTQLKKEKIPSGFSPDEYAVELVWAVNHRDGVKIPVSVVYKKELFKANGKNPMLLYGYGAYGVSIPASFNKNVVSLLDRGFVYAIAHVRGGDEMGMQWYKDAKLLHKKRTFEDFIAVAEYMVSKHYCSAGNIAIAGGSAGGMLIGAVVNERPELFKVALAVVPFVDVLNTMLDETLPLTPHEYGEWGNPRSKVFFKYMKSYSPYDNIKVQDYPHMFVRGGLSDPRVTYWEPAKYVAKLRHLKTNDSAVILKTDMGAGHQGQSGRFNHLDDVAEEYAFILQAFGMTE